MRTYYSWLKLLHARLSNIRGTVRRTGTEINSHSSNVNLNKNWETKLLSLIPQDIPSQVYITGEPLRAKYYGGLEKTSIWHDRKYCTVIG